MKKGLATAILLALAAISGSISGHYLNGAVDKLATDKPGKVATTTPISLEEALKGKTQEEKRLLKSKEIETKLSNKVYKRDKYTIEIVEKKVIDGGIYVFARVWDSNNNQIGFGKDGTVDIERFRIFNPPVLVDDPNGTVLRIESSTSTATSTLEIVPATYRRLREDPQEAILQSIESTLDVKKQKFDSSKIITGKIGNTTTTVYPAAGANSPVDGYAANVGAVWSTIRSATTGSSASVTDASQVIVESEKLTNYIIVRSAFLFDTSSIGSDNISSATFSVYSTASGDTSETTYPADLTLVSVSLATTSNITTSDYNIANWGTTEFASRILLSTFVGSAGYHNFSLNASGITNINKSGISQFSIRGANDLDNNAPTARSYGMGYYADQTGTANDPKLVMEHSAPETNVFRPNGLF